MPYLSPADVLRRFSRFALSKVRPSVPEDERFVRGQVGSMASTLRFLAGELEGRQRSVAEQERALREALDALAGVDRFRRGETDDVRSAWFQYVVPGLVEDAIAIVRGDRT